MNSVFLAILAMCVCIVAAVWVLENISNTLVEILKVLQGGNNENPRP